MPRAPSGTTRSPSRRTGPAPIWTLRLAVRLSLISNPAGEGLRHLGLRRADPLQRLHRAGLVDVDDRVELLGQAGVEVVAEPLGLRPIDDADRALEERAGDRTGGVPGDEEEL